MRTIRSMFLFAMGSMIPVVLPAAAVLLVPGPVHAEPTAPAEAPREKPGAPDELRLAYQKEYAFLAAQKRDLERRIADFNREAAKTVAETEARIDRLQDEVLDLERRADNGKDALAEAEKRRLDTQRNEDIVRATVQQAGVTFEEYRPGSLTDAAFQALPREEQLGRLFRESIALLGELSTIRKEPGAFYSATGDRLDGTLVRLGAIASYGVAESAAGILVPAGAGQWKLWPDAHPDAARALARGEIPPALPLFIHGSQSEAVEISEERGLLEYLKAGGLVAWFIVGLGLVGLGLAVLRILFLRRASASTGEIVEQVSELVRTQRLDEALAVCKRNPGSTSAVVAAALRNLHRDRESLDDIVNEAILHESTHLERFGTMILVIAAVAPLLGLLGTVTGMIATFDIITEHGTGDPKLLSGGISVALITTELGLIVAIPSLLVGNILSGWADRIKDDMEKAALRVSNTYERILVAVRQAA